MRKIKIGTRGSQLAMWQAHKVQELLQQAGLTTEIITIDTKGDKILNTSIAKIGSKGVFTEELEEQLRKQTIDIAVHSAKDVQADLADDLELLAFCKREKAHDVLVSYNRDLKIDGKNKILVGTSSTRRVAMMRRYYPNITTIDMRGNLQTRMRKLQEGICDALVLAYAGVVRMKFDQHIVKILSLDEFTPAAGQGSVAIECLKSLDNDLRKLIKNALNDFDTEICLRAERSFLKTLHGGCSIPSFAYAELMEDQVSVVKVTIRAGLISLNGKELVTAQFAGNTDESEKIGKQAAEKVLAEGGDKILKEIRG
jgi:hydroxymethylbilane synthase